ncbi:MAG TPA: hypothetical protein VGZ22_19635 [Isosphaeraceae bacterium]|jgi:hypothetical protein|nr:hypothetical protein [Isosphaeraceae bacterium]
MMALGLTLALGFATKGEAAGLEKEHAANPVYKALMSEGVTLGETPVAFPAPVLRDGMSADDQRAALRKVAGSDEAIEDLLRNSVTAPQILRLHDEGGKDAAIVRSGSLWFVVYADFDRLDPEATLKRVENQGPVEAGNMRFESRFLSEDELKTRGVTLAHAGDGQREWYTRLRGRLLDRIGFEATSRAFATQSAESVVVASRTVAFDRDDKAANQWWPIEHRDGAEVQGKPQPYPAGASYVKISRLGLKPGALLVEAHFAFEEPRAWFEGEPILRSKLSVVAQDQIRRLRRELAKEKKG